MADAPFNLGDGAKSLHTGFALRVYSDFSTTINLVTAGPTDGPARQVIVLAASDGDVLEVMDAAGNVESIPGHVVVGLPITCGIRRITANTTVTSVLVIW
jgi:hypothetical protein